MSGRLTRQLYDICAFNQDTKQITSPFDYVMESSKYINCNNLCQPNAPIPRNPVSIVDIESSLWGLDKVVSKCDKNKHPLCGPNGCLLTNDARIPQHITPYPCERGYDGENAVITTNINKIPYQKYKMYPQQVCNSNTNGYYHHY